MRRLFLAAALLATPLAGRLSAQNSATDDDRWLADCRNGGWNDDRGRACELRVVPLKLNGRSIEVDSRQNGSVRVVAWDGDSVSVTARIQANAEDDAAARAVLKDVRIQTDGRRITSDGPHEWRSEHWYVSYVLRVPRQFDLDLEAHNGSLGVNGVTGRMELRTTNGSVNLVDVGGDVRAHTQNGSVTVRLAGAKWDGRGLDAVTQNGSVQLGIPADYAAVIETETVNGRLNTDFPVTLQGRIGRHLTLPLNGGGATLRATTTNGSVTLSRR